MADESRNPLELDVVVQKFAESAEALANVRDQLQVLNELRETEEKANASLQETAEKVSDFSAKAADILKGLEEAQARVTEVLQSGAELIDRNELKGMPEIVKANSQSISEVDSRVVALDEKVTELDAMVRNLHSSTRQDVGSLKEKLENIHTDVKGPIIKHLFRRMD